jgi:hypothetical protein
MAGYKKAAAQGILSGGQDVFSQCKLVALCLKRGWEEVLCLFEHFIAKNEDYEQQKSEDNHRIRFFW